MYYFIILYIWWKPKKWELENKKEWKWSLQELSGTEKGANREISEVMQWLQHLSAKESKTPLLQESVEEDYGEYAWRMHMYNSQIAEELSGCSGSVMIVTQQKSLKEEYSTLRRHPLIYVLREIQPESSPFIKCTADYAGSAGQPVRGRKVSVSVNP